MTSKINYIAHRGLHNEIVPENSMLAFKKAIEKNIVIEDADKKTINEQIAELKSLLGEE